MLNVLADAACINNALSSRIKADFTGVLFSMLHLAERELDKDKKKRLKMMLNTFMAKHPYDFSNHKNSPTDCLHCFIMISSQ